MLESLHARVDSAIIMTHPLSLTTNIQPCFLPYESYTIVFIDLLTVINNFLSFSYTHKNSPFNITLSPLSDNCPKLIILLHNVGIKYLIENFLYTILAHESHISLFFDVHCRSIPKLYSACHTLVQLFEF